MNEIIPAKTPSKRRRFSKAFKAKVVAACQQPGASVAGVALANGLNVSAQETTSIFAPRS